MSFDDAMKTLIQHEGGYVDNKNDAGGPTCYGCTIDVVRAWRKKPVTNDEMKALALAEASAIYRANYWDKMRLDEVTDSGLQTVLFDQGVLFGVKVAILELQEALGVHVDGSIGHLTLKAIAEYPNKMKLGILFLMQMQARMTRIVDSNHTQVVFLKGWMNRNHDLMKALLC